MNDAPSSNLGDKWTAFPSQSPNLSKRPHERGGLLFTSQVRARQGEDTKSGVEVGLLLQGTALDLTILGEYEPLRMFGQRREPDRIFGSWLK